MTEVVVLKSPAMRENAGRYMSIAKGVTTLSSPRRKMIHACLCRRDVMVAVSSVISAYQRNGVVGQGNTVSVCCGLDFPGRSWIHNEDGIGCGATSKNTGILRSAQNDRSYFCF